MTHLSRRPVGLLTFLQVLTVLVALFGTWFAGVLGLLGLVGTVEIAFDPATTFGAAVFIVGALATVVGVSVCCYIALVSFFLLLQRMKRETAFTRRNCKALGRMALSCAVAAAMLFVTMGYLAVASLMPTELQSLRVEAVLSAAGLLMAWPFGFAVIALLIQGVRLLMDRALALREAQELVV